MVVGKYHIFEDHHSRLDQATRVSFGQSRQNIHFDRRARFLSIGEPLGDLLLGEGRPGGALPQGQRQIGKGGEGVGDVGEGVSDSGEVLGSFLSSLLN